MNQNFKQHLINLTQYNLWANKKIGGLIEELNDEVLDTVIVSSFPSLKATILHIWDAEVIWTLRLNETPVLDWPSKTFTGSRSDLTSGFLQASSLLVEFTTLLKDVTTHISYSNIKGENFTNTVSEIITHCINHSTFHRGQVITMLRQVGKTNLTSTDYITFARKKE